jgi:hypothetical protein
MRARLQVALKFMLRTALKQRQLDRLDREIRLLTLLHHPNIVELKEVIEMPAEGYVVFAMERCQRGELLKYITDHTMLSEAKFRPMFRDIISAVDYCHRNSVVHRDLKPGTHPRWGPSEREGGEGRERGFLCVHVSAHVGQHGVHRAHARECYCLWPPLPPR